MNTRPEVSVIVPTYNRPNRLPTAVETVLRQTWQDFEIVVVDDGSEEELSPIVSGVDDRIRVIRHETNKGRGAAVATGIREARGRFVATLDDDDQWLPEKLEAQLKAIRENPEVGLVYTGYRVVDEESGETVIERTTGLALRNGWEDIVMRTPIRPSSVLVRRSCLEEIGPIDESVIVDVDTYLRLHRVTEFRLLPRPLVVVSEHPGQIGRNPERVIRQLELLREKHGDLFRQSRRISAGLHYTLGRELFHVGRRASGMKEIALALRLRPRPAYLIGMLILLVGGYEAHRKASQLRTTLSERLRSG